MPGNILGLLFSFISLFLVNGTFGQDSSRSEPERLVTLYTGAVGLNARLYNGPEYQDYATRVKEGTPYFDSGTYKPGSIVFDSIRYENVLLRLDLVYEYLTILHPPSSTSIQLPNQLVSYFEIEAHPFVHALAAPGSVLKEGFYERLYAGKSLVYMKHRKMLEDHNRSNDIYLAAVPNNSYYVRNKGVWYNVKSAGGLRTAFKDSEKLVQQHLRRQKLRFRKNPEGALVEAARFYDQLTN